MELAVRMLLQKGVVIPVSLNQRGKGLYSLIFLVRKPNGFYRAIINLKELNLLVQYRKFKMETISCTVNLQKKELLQDAHFHVPIHNDFNQFLRFAVIMNSAVHHLQVQGAILWPVIRPPNLHKL